MSKKAKKLSSSYIFVAGISPLTILQKIQLALMGIEVFSIRTVYNGAHMFPLHAQLNDVLRTELAEYDDLTSALLARRGILTKEDAEKFLNPSYDLHLHDPLLMTDMPKASRRFADAII